MTICVQIFTGKDSCGIALSPPTVDDVESRMHSHRDVWIDNSPYLSKQLMGRMADVQSSCKSGNSSSEFEFSDDDDNLYTETIGIVNSTCVKPYMIELRRGSDATVDSELESESWIINLNDKNTKVNFQDH